LSTIKLDPIIDVLLQLAATVLLAAGTWAITRFTTWLGLKNSAQATATLDDALQKAVTYGLQQTQELIKQKGWDNVDVRNAALAHAAPYMIGHFPDALKNVGLDMSNTQAVQAAVMGALDRSFPHAAAVAAASPATPPATAPAPPTTHQLADQASIAVTQVDSAKP
jgi:hypothetical protein